MKYTDILIAVKEMGASNGLVNTYWRARIGNGGKDGIYRLVLLRKP